ncbi:STAS domain-containing protein [Trichocoleus sp. FACHB-262]|uniref:STAS domain-containing protein n=1 Tax=Trichocoleus sp. FACHB-262 TaxID=2692869 RepID=UPI00168717FD|nr:STAS domain-containing protein [Trichocoleus sp. FACHB-262]MBD2123496.1 STAS domain-containing protein [Trichocoleus sp. FACHB-262]
MKTVLLQPQVTVVQPQGHINASNSVELQQQLTTAVSSRQPQVVLIDMSKVESLDSTGLMTLVSALSSAQRFNHRFSLCCMSASIRIIFELTQLDRVFEIFEDRASFEAAIAVTA